MSESPPAGPGPGSGAGTGPVDGAALRGPGRPRPLARMLLVGTVVLSWAVLVPFLWQSVTTVPSAERLREMSARIMHPPGPGTFFRTTGQSFLELAVLVALLWPWWPRFWLGRLALAFVLMAGWAIATMPLELTELEWYHHRWMVGVTALLALAFLVSALAGLGRAMREHHQV